MENIKLCIIIPTYNNERTVVDMIRSVKEYCNDVIVVNDGSTDSTHERLLDCSIEGLHIIEYAQNKGKGHALVKGFKKAREMGFTHAITIDADGQHYASDIPTLLAGMNDNANGIIVGSRNLIGQNISGKSSFANKFSNFWFRFQTGVNLPDTQSGYRLYALDGLRGLSMITARYEAELEFLVFASWSGVKITSVPIQVYYPPQEERVSHFRPAADFTRISVLNTILSISTIFYAWPVRLLRKIKVRSTKY